MEFDSSKYPTKLISKLLVEPNNFPIQIKFSTSCFLNEFEDISYKNKGKIEFFKSNEFIIDTQ